MDFRSFDNYPSKRMRFLRSHDTLSLFLHDIMTCMHISKIDNEIHGGRPNLTIRKHAKILTTPSQIYAKNSRFYRYSRFHSFQAHSESILCILDPNVQMKCVNMRICVSPCSNHLHRIQSHLHRIQNLYQSMLGQYGLRD